MTTREYNTGNDMMHVLERAGGLGGYGMSTWGTGNVSAWTSTIYDTRIEPYFGDVREGGWVVDRAHVEAGKRLHDGLASPMLSLTLAPREVDRCPQPSSVMLAGLEGGFQALATIKAALPTWSGLDRVDLATWLEIQRANGARVGQRRGDVIVWSDGATSPIAPAELRWNVPAVSGT